MRELFCLKLKLYLVNILIVFLLLNFESNFSRISNRITLFQSNDYCSSINLTKYYGRLEWNSFLHRNNCLRQTLQLKNSAEHLSIVHFKNTFDNKIFNLSGKSFSDQTDKITDLFFSKNKIIPISENFESICVTEQSKNNYKSFLSFQKYTKVNRKVFFQLSVACAGEFILT